jgi:hypothetical protein
LLDVPYFHVVFTVPDQIATIAFQNQVVVYDILFRAVSETLRTIAVSTIALSDGSLIAAFDGLPASASRVL